MCGRFALRTSLPEIARILGAEEPDPGAGGAPRYNIAPTQSAPVCITLPDAGRRLVPMRWGLVPGWAKDLRIGARMINARGETVADKPAFRAPFRRRRCLVPADGYYEWLATPGGKQPYLITAVDGAPFFMAGLWDSRERADEPRIDTFTVITVAARGAAAGVHDRMPAVLGGDDHQRWLDPAEQDRDALTALLSRAGPVPMTVVPVSTHVNSAANDDPRCVEPVADPPA